jgi:hypothetical protein
MLVDRLARRTPARRRPLKPRRFFAELLEDRALLAQTTGLFLNAPGASDGFTLFSPNTTGDTYLIDKNANIVNTWTSNYAPGLLGYLLPDGSLLRAGSPTGQGGNGFIEAAGAGGLLERRDWDGNLTWQFSYSTPTHLQHHDIEPMPNGNVLIIAWTLKTEAEATAAGRDPNLPGPGYLYPDSIVEIQPDLVNGGGTVVWEWHVWDHLVQEFDATKNNYYGPTGVEDHPELIDLNFVSVFDDGAGEPEDWTHANGIDYNAELDQIVLSVREFSEFWIIDHSTTTAEAAGHTGGNSGKGGDLLYRWGNPQTYDRGDASDRVLFYQHDAKWIEEGHPGAGNITVLNNGFGRPGQDFTTVEEITAPVDGSNYTLEPGQAYGPEETAWTYTAPLADFTAIISGATRLANGNTQITYGVKGTFVEVTPEGEEVWRYVNPYITGKKLGLEEPIPTLGINDPVLGTLFANFTFQAIDYSAEYVAQFAPTVVGRHIFYNNSKFDGGSTSINSSDDAAIATDKVAYLPGSGPATFSNITSNPGGINGIMIDIANAEGTITAADFTFRVSAPPSLPNDPSTWAAAPGPVSVSVRAGAGTSGSDRVEILWAGGAIVDRWLEVIVEGNDAAGGFNTNTGLAASDIFFFGNRIGDTGSGSATLAITNATDVLSIRNNPATGVGVDSVLDINRDGNVDAADSKLSQAFKGTLIKIDISEAAAALRIASSGGSSVAFALATRTSGASVAIRESASALGQVTPAPASVKSSAGHPATAGDAPRAAVVLAALDAARDTAHVDDELLEALVGSRGS